MPPTTLFLATQVPNRPGGQRLRGASDFLRQRVDWLGQLRNIYPNISLVLLPARDEISDDHLLHMAIARAGLATRTDMQYLMETNGSRDGVLGDAVQEMSAANMSIAQ